MVNPGGFQGSRKIFLDDQQDLYAAAVEENHAADAVADIQRRYFKRFPLSLPHTQEPTEEFLAAVDDDAPDPDLLPPQQGTLSDEVYARDRRVYELQVAELKMRKAQIKRRLHYQYTKVQGKKTTFEMGTTDPMAVLMTKLTGGTVQKPRQKTAYNLWGPANRFFIDPVFSERVREGNVPAKQHAALRSAIYKELFEELPEEERKEWIEKAETEHQEALSKANSALKAGASSAPEDRQRVIEGLPKFVQPILDIIAEHTGWKVTLLIGGPEPADGGRLNMTSLHSGTTSGAVKMNFGRSERSAYRDNIVPTFGKFLKKCYSIQECRECALPEKNSFSGLVGVDAQDGIEVHTFDDGMRREGDTYIQVAAPRQKSSAASGSGSRSMADPKSTANSMAPRPPPIKFGPPKAMKNKDANKNTSAGIVSSNGGTPKAGYASRGPSPPISRAVTPTPAAATSGNNLHQAIATSRAVSVEAAAVPHIPTATPRAASVDKIAAPHAASVEGNTMPHTARAASADVVAAPRAAFIEDSAVQRAARAASVDVVTAARTASTEHLTDPLAARAASASVPRTAFIEESSAARAARAASVDVVTAARTAEHSTGSLAARAASVDVIAAPASIKDVAIPRAGFAESIAGPGAGCTEDITIPRTSRATSADIITAPCADSVNDITVPASAAPPASSSNVITAPRAASLEDIAVSDASVPARQTAASNTGRLASGSIAVPSVQQIVAAENEKQVLKRKGGSANISSTQKKRRTSGQGISSSSDHMDVDNPNGYPDWVSNALTVLQSTHLGSEWDLLITKWLAFEQTTGYDRGGEKLGTQNRPRIIADWIKNGRSPKFHPEIKDVGVLSAGVIAWWRGLQPDWRIDSNGDANSALCREGGSWEHIRRPGVNGLLSVIAALFFWGGAAQNAPGLSGRAWLEVLDDVGHVLDQLL